MFLEDGEWTVGETADCDVYLDSAGPRNLVLSLSGRQARITWQGADSPSNTGVTLQDEARWTMAAWSLHLRSPEQESAPPAAPPRTRTGWPARLPAFALAASLLTTSLVATSAWIDPWQAGSPAPSSQAAGARLHAHTASVLLSQGLESLRVEAPASADTPPIVRGHLASADACERFNLVRTQLGADQFSDQVVCLPELLNGASEFLAGTGVTVHLDGERVAIRGRLADAAFQPRVDAALAHLKPWIPTTLEMEDAALSSTAHEQVARQIRSRVLALHPGSPGYLVTRDGERVFEGGRMHGGFELARVGEQDLTLRHGGKDIDVAL